MHSQNLKGNFVEFKTFIIHIARAAETRCARGHNGHEEEEEDSTIKYISARKEGRKEERKKLTISSVSGPAHAPGGFDVR